MDAVTLLKQNLDVERVLSHYDVEYKYFGDYIRCPCPIHKGDNPTAFVVNQDFLWVCHTNGDCGKGDVFTFIEKMEELEFPHDFPLAVNKLAEILGIDISNLEILERKNDYIKDVEKFLKYMKSKKKERREFEKYELNAESKQVKVFRNFKEETLIHFGLQYIKEITLDKQSGEGQFTLYERVGIPIKKDGEIIGYSLRKIRAKDNPKWFHIPHTMETGELLYNIDACKEHDSIVVVEGMFDVWAFYEIGITNFVCTFGAHLTDEQYFGYTWEGGILASL